MRFHVPIDDVQWKAAAATHAQMRRNLLALRRQYPPASNEERRILRRYRDIIQLFARELLKPRVKISADRLNDLSESAVEAFVQYMFIRRTR